MRFNNDADDHDEQHTFMSNHVMIHFTDCLIYNDHLQSKHIPNIHEHSSFVKQLHCARELYIFRVGLMILFCISDILK